MPYSLKQITQPSHEPVSLVDMKDFLRIDTTDQDNVIGSLITTARMSVETHTNRCLVNQQFEISFDRFPGSWPFSYGFGSSLLSPFREIHLPRYPLYSVDVFQYTDMTTGSPVAMIVNTDYQVSGAEPGRLQPAYGQAWPIARWSLESILIRFTAGYGDTSASPSIGAAPPAVFNTAIKLMVGHWFENRESQEMPKAAENLIQPYRVFDFAPVMNNWERWAR
jgi:uncharacterized phiE125 gp8 family phage protein